MTAPWHKPDRLQLQGLIPFLRNEKHLSILELWPLSRVHDGDISNRAVFPKDMFVAISMTTAFISVFSGKDAGSHSWITLTNDQF
jgi:hypothetical protein